MASAVSLLVGALLFIGGIYVPDLFGMIDFPKSLFQGIFGVSLFLSLTPCFWMFLFSRKEMLCPISQASTNSCLCDKKIFILHTSMFSLSLIGLVVSSQNFLPIPLVYALALFATGGIVDLLKCSFQRIQERCSPEGVANWLLSTCRAATRKGDEKAIMESFELVFSLLVTYAKREDINSMRCFSMRAVGIIEELLRAVSTMSSFSVTKEDTLLDRYSIAEAITSKRLAWLMKVTGESDNPTALEEVMRLYGKLFMVFHNYHDSLGNLLFISLSQNLLKVTQPEGLEKDAEYMSVCSEVVKSLIDRSIEKRVSEKDAILRILAVLETHVKECFRKDRSISPAFLMQPFAEVGQLLGSALYTSLLNREDILTELRRTLAQFAALESVSTRLDVGEPGADTRASYHEDLPFQRRD